MAGARFHFSVSHLATAFLAACECSLCRTAKRRAGLSDFVADRSSGRLSLPAQPDVLARDPPFLSRERETLSGREPDRMAAVPGHTGWLCSVLAGEAAKASVQPNILWRPGFSVSR